MGGFTLAPDTCHGRLNGAGIGSHPESNHTCSRIGRILSVGGGDAPKFSGARRHLDVVQCFSRCPFPLQDAA